MRNVSSRISGVALAASAALVCSSGFAFAQYDPTYAPYQRSYDYSRDYPISRRDFGERERPLPRDIDDLPRRRTLDDRASRARAPKHRRKPSKIETSKAPQHAVKGPYQVVVSLGKQHITIYGAEGLIRRSTVSTGMRGHATPTGVFSVLGKEYFHRSNLYSNAPMPLMQRITWSGVALHQGPQPGYPASHGCIRLTGEFAHFLWKTTRIGARVIVAHDDPAPVDIANPKLFEPVKKTYDPVIAAASLATSASADGKHAARGAAPSAEDANPVAAAASVHNGFYKLPVVSSRKGPVSVFISRKTAKLYVRYNYEPIFETAVGIEQPGETIGTHVFTAMQTIDGGQSMRWNVVSIPTPVSEAVAEKKRPHRRMLADAGPMPIDAKASQSPAAALERIDIPRETTERIAELLSPGSSLTISDYGISEETGNETDFIILTR